MRRVLLLLGLVLCLALPATAVASAASYDPLSGACSAAKDTSSADSSAKDATACDQSVTGKDPITGPNGILHKITVFVAMIAGIAAVIMMLVGAIQYVTSNGDAKQAADARGTIISGLVGLAVVAASGGILLFVISKV
jgi:hypothetical protein